MVAGHRIVAIPWFCAQSCCLVFVCDIHVHYFDCPRRDVVCLGSETVSCMTIAEVRAGSQSREFPRAVPVDRMFWGWMFGKVK